MTLGVTVRMCWAVALCVGVASCGKKSPLSPPTPGDRSGNTKTACSVIVGNTGSATTTVDGAAFTGITPTGSATAAGTALVLFGTNTDDTTVTLGTLAAVDVKF